MRNADADLMLGSVLRSKGSNCFFEGKTKVWKHRQVSVELKSIFWYIGAWFPRQRKKQSALALWFLFALCLLAVLWMLCSEQGWFVCSMFLFPPFWMFICIKQKLHFKNIKNWTDAFCCMTHPSLAIMKEGTITPPNTLLWWVDLLVKLLCQAWGII